MMDRRKAFSLTILPALALMARPLHASTFFEPERKPPAMPPPKPHQAVETHTIVPLGDERWRPIGEVLPYWLPNPDARVCVLDGDPTRKGLFTMRIKIPDGYKVGPHYHPVAERFTVIKGHFFMGMGDYYDESKMTSMPAGSYAWFPPYNHHFGRVEGETIFQITGEGPWYLYFVHPNDPLQHSVPVKPK